MSGQSESDSVFDRELSDSVQSSPKFGKLEGYIGRPPLQMDEGHGSKPKLDDYTVGLYSVDASLRHLDSSAVASVASAGECVNYLFIYIRYICQS